jgi:hypothetical protein
MGLHTRPLAIAALALGVLLGGCGSDDSSADTPVGTVGQSDAGPVDANEASEAELEAAFEAAGIPNAEKWAHEVEEYRPYPTDDPTFAKLRDELSEYNPGDQVLDQIIAALTL